MSDCVCPGSRECVCKLKHCPVLEMPLSCLVELKVLKPAWEVQSSCLTPTTINTIEVAELFKLWSLELMNFHSALPFYRWYVLMACFLKPVFSEPVEKSMGWEYLWAVCFSIFTLWMEYKVCACRYIWEKLNKKRKIKSLIKMLMNVKPKVDVHCGMLCRELTGLTCYYLYFFKYFLQT